MATVHLPNVLPIFPSGSKVYVYTDIIIDSGEPRPVGAPLTSAVVAVDGAITFEGLPHGLRLAAVQQQGAQWVIRYFTVLAVAEEMDLSEIQAAIERLEDEMLGAGAVISVNGADGIVVLTAADVGAPSVAELAVEVAAREAADALRVLLAQVDADTSLAANSDAKIPTQKAIKAYVDALIPASNAVVFKGAKDCSGNPNYPAADAGHIYVASVAGRIGGGAGVKVEAGDFFVCKVDGSAEGTQAAVGANWNVIQTNLIGAVTGPEASTVGNIPTWGNVSGNVLQDSGKAHSTDGTLGANSDAKIPTEKATKTYVDAAAALKQDKATAATDEELAAAKAALEERDLARDAAVREEKPLAMFPNEHGWTGNGVGAYSDAGGELILNTDRSFKIETDGAGGTSIATSPALTAVDLTGKHVVFHSQLSFASRLKTVKLRLASGNIATDYAEVTVWNEEDDTIPLQSTFERQSFPTSAFTVTGVVNWSAITKAQILVVDKGGGNKFSLYVAGIYAAPRRPQTVVSICFDDNYESAYTEGRKILSAYRYPATAYVITDLVGSGGRMTLAQLKTLRDLHDWEIAGHAYTAANHNLSAGLDSIATAAEREAEFNGLRDWLDENGFRRATFAYPKGSAKMEKCRPSVIKDYGAGRSTGPGVETVPPRDNYTLRGNSIDGLSEGATAVKAKIDQAIAQGGWLILTFHNLVAGAPAASTEFKTSEFNEVVDYIRTKQLEGKDVQVRTVRDAMDAVAPGNSVGARVWYETKVFTVPDEIKVPSGDTDFIPPMFVSLRSGQTAKVVKVIHRLNSGTNAKVKLQKNGSDLTGFTAIEVKAETQTTDPADQAVADGDRLALVVESISGTPKNMTFAVVIEHTEL